MCPVQPLVRLRLRRNTSGVKPRRRYGWERQATKALTDWNWRDKLPRLSQGLTVLS